MTNPFYDDPSKRARYQTKILGHLNVEKALLNSYRSGHMHHGLILAGPYGIGKASMAWRIAKFLLTHPIGGASDNQPTESSLFENSSPTAPSYQTMDIDPENAELQRILALTHSGLFTINAPSVGDISVDDVRKLLTFAQLNPGEGHTKMMLIDSCERLNMSSANALLKIMEEPSQHTYLILTTNQLAKLPATLRSRCQVINMYPLNEQDMDQVLDQIMPHLDANEKKILKALSSGSPGFALDIQAAGGLNLYQKLFQIIHLFPNLDSHHMNNVINSFTERNDARAHLAARSIVSSWIHTLIKMSAGHHAPKLQIENEEKLFADMVRKVPLNQWLHLWENSFCHIDKHNNDRKAAWISLFLNWSKLLV
ncbi:MAG: AAA family ATPase [Pseudomonadota bacterium]